MEYQVFLCLFQKNSAMATLGLKEIGKILWKVGKKICLVGCLSLAKVNWDSQLGKLVSLPSQMIFFISFKHKVVIAKFIGKMQKKSGITKSGLDAMPLFLLYDLLKNCFCFHENVETYLCSFLRRRL